MLNVTALAGFGIGRSAPAGPAISSIGTATSSSGATVSIAVGAAGVPAGSTIILFAYEAASALGGTAADSAGNAYTSIGQGFLGGAVNQGYGIAKLFYKYNAAALVNGDSITFTKKSSGDMAAITAMCVTGVLSASDPLDASVTISFYTDGTGSYPSYTSNAPSMAGEMFVALMAEYLNYFTQDTVHGWTAPPVAAFSNGQVCGGSKINIGTGALTYEPTIDGTDGLTRAWIIGLKPA